MKPRTVLALDVGSKRIGLAVASYDARLANPLRTIAAEGAIESIKAIITELNVRLIVVGLPRGMEGQDTQQTLTIRHFAETLARAVQIPVQLQDETLTSVVAEDLLEYHKKPIAKGDIDAQAAALILGDFLTEHAEQLV